MPDAPAPLPPSFGVRPLTGSVRAGRTLTGGVPRRRVDLSSEAAGALDGLLAGCTVAETASSTGLTPAAVGAVARRLVDTGIAGPVPGPEARRAAPPATDVAAVIPAHDAAATIADAIAGLDGVQEIVVVDDGSSDDTAAVARAAGARVIRNEVPTGPAAARNLGVRATAAAIVVVLDSDTRPEPGWLEPLLAHLVDPATGGVAPRIETTDDGTPLGAYETAAGPLDLGAEPAVVRPDGPVPFVSTTALVLRRDLWEHLEGFSESLRFGEDLDFAWRAAAARRPLVHEPAATVGHRHRATLRTHLVNRLRYGTASGPLSRRHPGHPRAAVAPPLLALAAAGAVLGLPRTATGLAIASLGTTTRRLAAAGHSGPEAATEAMRAHARWARGLAAAVSRPWLPVTLTLAVARRRSRPVVAGAVLARLLLGSGRPSGTGGGTPTWAALRVLDDLAFGAGVLRGCIEASTVAPLTTRAPEGADACVTVLGTEVVLA